MKMNKRKLNYAVLNETFTVLGKKYLSRANNLFIFSSPCTIKRLYKVLVGDFDETKNVLLTNF